MIIIYSKLSNILLTNKLKLVNDVEAAKVFIEVPHGFYFLLLVHLQKP